jgi:phage repressor protein C with HTH and peptisase S24 domain
MKTARVWKEKDADRREETRNTRSMKQRAKKRSTRSTQGKSWQIRKRRKKENKEKILGLTIDKNWAQIHFSPIYLDTQGPIAQFLFRPKFRPNPNWAPEISKVQSLFAPATSKVIAVK